MIYTSQPVVRYLETWCKANLGRHDSPGYAAYHEAYEVALRHKRLEQRAPHDNRGGFGMSGAGGCLRAQAFRRGGVPGRPPEGDTLVTWEVGHLLECAVLGVLAASGFEVDQVQAPVSYGPFSSAIDGHIKAAPLPLSPTQPLLSIKTASFKMGSPPRPGKAAKRYGFAALPLEGIRVAEPSWYAQAQLEMAATDAEATLFVVLAKDMIAAYRGDAVFTESGSLSWYAEVVPRNNETARRLAVPYAVAADLKPALVRAAYWTKGETFVELPSPGDVGSGWKGPNQEATGSFNPCFGCAYAPVCQLTEEL